MRKLHAANQHPTGSQHHGFIPLTPLRPPPYPTLHSPTPIPHPFGYKRVISSPGSLLIQLWPVRTHGASWLCRGVLLSLESLWWWGKSLRTAAPCGLTAPLSHPYASQPRWCWLATWECSFSGVTLKMRKHSVAITTLWPDSSLVSSLFLPMRSVSTLGVSWLHGSVLLPCESP